MINKPERKLYVLTVTDDIGDILLIQNIVSDSYNAVDLQGQKHQMFYGFGTTYEIGKV